MLDINYERCGRYPPNGLESKVFEGPPGHNMSSSVGLTASEEPEGYKASCAVGEMI